MRQRREQHAVHPRKQDADERAPVRRVGGSVPARRVGDAQRDAASTAAASAATNPSTAASRAVFFFSSFTSVSLSSVSPRADASSDDARSTAGRVAARARRNRRRRSASAPLFFFRVGDERAVFFSRRARVHAIQPGLELLPFVCFGV